MYKKIKFSDQNLILSLVLLFALFVGLKIHGYSFSTWHNIIDGSPADEILTGHPQFIRTDDWGLELPLALSQITHSPPFPIINHNIGLGENILLPMKVPSFSGLTIFRPSVWGYFLGGDYGLAWAWWYMAIGLFVASYLMFNIISYNDKWISFFAALAVAWSPYFQVWSYHKAEIFIGMALAFVCIVKIISQKNQSGFLLWGALLGWIIGCMVFNFMYPPILIVCGLLLLALTAGYLLNLISKRTLIQSENKKIYLGWGLALFSALVVFGSSVAFLIHDSWDALTAINNTTYPGRRISTGGGVLPWSLFADHFFYRFAAPETGTWGPLGNECEAASFLIFFPIILPFYFYKFYQNRKNIDWLVICISIYLLLVLTYQWIGLPLWAAHFTLLAKALPVRVFGGIGFANFILCVRFLADFKKEGFKNIPIKKYVATANFLLLIYLVYSITEEIPNYATGYLILGCVLYFLFFGLLLSPKLGANWFFVIQCIVLLIYNGNYNPIVIGGFDFILNNTLSKKIQTIQANAEPNAKWIATSASPRGNFILLANYLKMLGVPSIGSYQCPPQKEIWKQFKLTNEEQDITNQCAFVYFQSADINWKIVPNSNGNFTVFGRPGDETLDRLNVRYYLVEAQNSNEFDFFFNNSKFKLIDSFFNRRIYERIVK